MCQVSVWFVLNEIIFKKAYLGFSFTKGRLTDVPCMPCPLSGNSLNELTACIFGTEFGFNWLGQWLTCFFELVNFKVFLNTVKKSYKQRVFKSRPLVTGTAVD